MSGQPDIDGRHLTTRRGFVAAVGLLVLTLYFVWAAYGAAPTNLRFLAGEVDAAAPAGHSGHGAVEGGMAPEDFAELTERFIAEFALEDGSVRPRRPGEPAEAGAGGHGGHGAHGAQSDGHGAAAASAHSAASGHASAATHAEAAGGDPIDVYIMALQFRYEPAVLRLQAGAPYRIRMMSMDVGHGASIRGAGAGRIMRRPARAMVDAVMTFEKRGEYMIYCTLYCGDGHDEMRGKIIVE